MPLYTSILKTELGSPNVPTATKQQIANGVIIDSQLGGTLEISADLLALATPIATVPTGAMANQQNFIKAVYGLSILATAHNSIVVQQPNIDAENFFAGAAAAAGVILTPYSLMCAYATNSAHVYNASTTPTALWQIASSTTTPTNVAPYFYGSLTLAAYNEIIAACAGVSACGSTSTESNCKSGFIATFTALFGTPLSLLNGDVITNATPALAATFPVPTGAGTVTADITALNTAGASGYAANVITKTASLRAFITTLETDLTNYIPGFTTTDAIIAQANVLNVCTGTKLVADPTNTCVTNATLVEEYLAGIATYIATYD